MIKQFIFLTSNSHQKNDIQRNHETQITNRYKNINENRI